MFANNKKISYNSSVCFFGLKVSFIFLRMYSTKFPVIIFFGPPGSGKGTQANLVCEKLQLENISTGNSIRNFAKNNDNPNSPDYDLAQKVKKKLNTGELQDFEDLKYIVENDIINTVNSHKNVLIEGMPRTPKQAEWLANFFESKKLDCLFFHFNLSEEEAVERLSHRYYAPHSDIPYSSFEEAQKHCKNGQEPIRRTDDQDQSITRKRYFSQYSSVKDEIISTFISSSQAKVLEIDASPAEKEILEILLAEIKKFERKIEMSLIL